jgi:hypothetical protein
LFPKLPLGPQGAVYLLQGKTIPLHLKPISIPGLDLIQPNCCFVGIGSKVVGPDLQLDFFSHLSLLIQMLSLTTVSTYSLGEKVKDKGLNPHPGCLTMINV